MTALGRTIAPSPVDWHPGLPDDAEAHRLVERLSPAQLVALRLMGHGWTPQQIARCRGVALTTVRKQIDGAIRRLEVVGHLQALAVLRRAGVL